jgi:DNA ligase (NAD+)
LRNPAEAAHYCPNLYGCPTQIKGRIEHFTGRRAMNINIAEATIDQLYRQKLISNIADLYAITYEQLIGLERFAHKSATNLLKSIEDSKKVPFPRVLYALGIRMVGETVAKKLAKHFGSLDALQNAGTDELTNVEEIGERIAGSVMEFFVHPVNKEIVERLKSYGLQFSMDKSGENLLSAKLAGKNFVISGTFTKFSRDELKNLIERHGGKNVSSVSSNTNYLVAGEKTGPEKLKKAKQFNIPVIGETDFLEMIK